MALIQQQAIEFPFRREDGGTVIAAPRHLLAELRRSAVSTDQPKGLVLLSGPPAVYRLGLCAAVDRALAGEPVLYLAGANVFDPFLVGRLARASRVAPAHVLQQIRVSRAFTCHQMVRLVTDCLPSALRTYDARFVILAGPLDTLYDQSVPEPEAVRLFRAMTNPAHAADLWRHSVRRRVGRSICARPRMGCGYVKKAGLSPDAG
jgi:hypothetical protein